MAEVQRELGDAIGQPEAACTLHTSRLDSLELLTRHSREPRFVCSAMHPPGRDPPPAHHLPARPNPTGAKLMA